MRPVRSTRAESGTVPSSLLDALRDHGVRRIRRIQFKANRTRILSTSRDGETLYLHVCFRSWGQETARAIATVLHASRRSPEQRRAAAFLRACEAEWRAAQPPSATKPQQPPRPSRCCATPEQLESLTEMYVELNRSHFGGRLPTSIPLRLSDRMTRRLGHVRYYRDEDGTRSVVELALSRRLFVSGDAEQLRDTFLHEMAHVEAWLEHGHGGHGPIWKQIARRVGCEPRASVD